MKRAWTFPFWVAMLTVVLLGLLVPLAHACSADPRWTAGPSGDSVLDDVLDLLLAAGGLLVGTPAIALPQRATLGLVAEVGAGCTSPALGSVCPTRAPPVLLARSV